MGRSERLVLVLAALAISAGAAAWIADSSQTSSFASAALPPGSDHLLFEDRFAAISGRERTVDVPALQSLDRRALTAIQTKLWDAKALLAQQLMYGDWRFASIEDVRSSIDTKPAEDAKTAEEAKSADEGKPAVTASGIPLPRPRPVVVASLDAQASLPASQPDNAPKADNRTLLDKLSDLLPGRVTLASLTPESGLMRHGPDLAALGYDSTTAVYDISARAVYLPGGVSLEAHSGMGGLRDDPGHVDQRMVGATPPAVYDLKPREKLFHGVPALRMTPADGSSIFGRSGLLVHPYMLGPEGDSNGCVSIKNYERFLKAYNDGEIHRLVVVPSLNHALSASQRATSQS
ncbi:DUF2778 domain-containing protein [Bradyrhizobium sp. ARR65]|uniref:DUF2778 domain-containing protein n=1 Tax=Bradyrhizobium sp. ARR65 TaxID=1040989 RepID=UPI001FDAA0D1|nr:DUF2778 domain-containing protein [Bradyrhizobium sp. ARR65]